MKKLIIFLIIIIIAVLAFIIYEVRSATATPDLDQPRVILEIDEGVVEIWPAGGDTWQKGRDGQNLGGGDRVRTLRSSRASIIFYDTSVTRLDENTEIVIEEVSIDSENYLTQNVGMELVAGRVWSRILSLLDLDSKFEVKTSTVVATVRGTAFGISVDERGEVELDVIENLVDATLYSVSSATDEIILDKPRTMRIEAGNYLFVGPFKKLKQGEELPDIFSLKMREITQDRIRARWFIDNANQDEEFLKRVEGLRRDQLRKYIKRLPDSPLFGLQGLAERLGYTLKGKSQNKTDLQKIFIARRLSEIAELAHQDKVGLATQELVKFENLLKSDGQQQIQLLSSVFPNIFFLYKGFWADVLPSDKSYRLKQRVEELINLVNAPEEQKIQWRLMNLEERLRESERLVSLLQRDLAINVLDAAKFGLENLKTETEILPESEKKQIILDRIAYDLSKLEILRQEVEKLEAAPAEAIQELELEGIATEELHLEETQPGAPEEQPAEPQPGQPGQPASEPVTEKVLQSLSVSALPNPVYVNQASNLTAQATYTDGTSENVAARADWQTFGDIGTIAAGVFTAGSKAGSAQIQATYTSGGVTKTASLTMTVKVQPAELVSIRLMSSKIVLGYYDTATLFVEATYGDKSTKNVTSGTTFSHSNPSVGALEGSSFSSYGYDGVTTVTATYSENGVTVNDVIVLQVQYSP